MKLYLVTQRYREGRSKRISRWVAMASTPSGAIDKVINEYRAQIEAGFPLEVEEYDSDVVCGLRIRMHMVDR